MKVYIVSESAYDSSFEPIVAASLGAGVRALTKALQEYYAPDRVEVMMPVEASHGEGWRVEVRVYDSDHNDALWKWPEFWIQQHEVVE